MPAKGAGMAETAQPASDEPANDASNKAMELQIDENQVNGKAVGTPSAAGASPTTPHSQKSDGKSPMHSSLSSSGGTRSRQDSRGINIERGQKAHQVKFKDEVNQGTSLVETKEVKAYKNGSSGNCGCVML